MLGQKDTYVIDRKTQFCLRQKERQKDTIGKMFLINNNKNFYATL